MLKKLVAKLDFLSAIRLKTIQSIATKTLLLPTKTLFLIYKEGVVLDDITTSGATLAECAKALKQAGAKKVISVVLATAYHD